ncbi:FAD-dependent thymidylate synthase [Posidoniimonas polymericola]|uniref:FAD-dependent thymidylate synthase n=2 Tax=Posidoniimonas polymericola TaxID=2528002 RepID=A0A5C5XU70_9BACT|nr:FAD-dependent thymidylate synthase [Posidoniimonas polymericola]
MDDHAQHEIRAYASVIGREIVAKWVPIAWEAFVDYRLEAMHLSRLDQVVINLLLAGQASDATEAAKSFGWIMEDGDGLKPNRERSEFEIKAAALGLTPTWL